MTTLGSYSRRESRDSADQVIPEGPDPEDIHILQDLRLRWGLAIKQADGESPNKRQEKLAVANPVDALAYECSFKINFLGLKEKTTLLSAYNQFQDRASSVQSGWVHKPDADGDLLPRSHNTPRHPKSAAQREELLKCLLRCIDPPYYEAKKQQARTLREKISLNHVSVPAVTPSFTSQVREFDDTPIPFSLNPKGKGKRRSEAEADLQDQCKRTRMPYDDLSSQMIIDAIDEIPVVTRQPEFHALPLIPEPVLIGNSRSSRTISALQAFALDENPEDCGSVRRILASTTADTSFTSIVPTIFDDDSDASDVTYHTTQTSTGEEALDSTLDRRWSLEQPEAHPLSTTETPYGSSFDENDLDHSFRIPPEDLLRRHLQNVFPDLPPSLASAPLAVRYEFTRIFSYANVDMMDLHFPKLDFSKFLKYENLWTYLRNFHALKGKDFPEKSDIKAWKASFGTYLDGQYSAILSAKLTYNNTIGAPFFKLQLQPLKTDLSHRLSRRFGPDRFLELSLPSLTGRKLPKIFTDAEKAGRGDDYRNIFIEWLLRKQHKYLGNAWGAFCLRDAVKKKKKTEFQITSVDEIDNRTSFSVHLFATDGFGFRTSELIPQKGESLDRHTKMSISALWNWLIPLDQNKHRKALKLYSRIALGLSKSSATVEVQTTEFRYLPNLLSAKNEVMNDGCGRLSLKMAKDIAQCLGLSYTPSAFQGRIGGAKGLWLVEYNDLNDQRWIEIYPSQTKWSRDLVTEHSGTDDPDHRTFDVVGWAKPLSAAKLTLQFLQILEGQGKNKTAMRNAISEVFIKRLNYEIDTQRGVMQSPQGLRQWVRGNSGSSFQSRVKYGYVAHMAGLPITLEEKINMLLDAGFHPEKLKYLSNLLWTVYGIKCDILTTKLNISVGLSTNAYMAVDFSDTLEPDEVHLNFSNTFTDDLSGFSECLLDGIDILVARSPAHFTSDIQKVKAVWKHELKSVKDVIVFSKKGNYPLAQKLSGGDYDGDMAWICWEPSIVNEFVNAEPRECPNLIKLGYIQQEKTSYADLASENSDPFPAFLDNAFKFNLNANMLGICTVFKDNLCYTMNSVNNKETIFLSTLLSDLVDQHKQGLIFTPTSWEKFKSAEIKTVLCKPAYKTGERPTHMNPSNSHIIDHLKFDVAKQIIHTTKTKFHESLRQATIWDPDLTKLYSEASDQASTSAPWVQLITHVTKKIKDIKAQWSLRFNTEGKPRTRNNNGGGNDNDPEARNDWAPFITDLHDQWVEIAPPEGNLLSKPLTLGGQGVEYNNFALLKASIGYSITSTYGGRFIWWMAGRQLAYIKAQAQAQRSPQGHVAIVAPEMFAMLSPDNPYVKLHQKQQADAGYSETLASESMIGDDDGEWDDWDD